MHLIIIHLSHMLMLMNIYEHMSIRAMNGVGRVISARDRLEGCTFQVPRLEPMPLSCKPTTLSNTPSEQLKTLAPPTEVGSIRSQAEQLIVRIGGALAQSVERE